ncbi:hypothetical protein [Paenibacillus daejeonensis]|uniref:hypothetical protein n=1 Tax=Paenibacillus daejeonensis TaxID=135193 RepID=UPI0003600C6E|nr:hypothetical protein [Paenibacillus daejeonensis]
MELYFNDRLFSRGRSEIKDANGVKAGTIDLERARILKMTSDLSVYGPDAQLRCSANYRFRSNRWEISDATGTLLGWMKIRASFFSKKFQYDADSRGVYTIEAPAFSRSYTIVDQNGSRVASFEQTNNWLRPGAFRLLNESPLLDDYELVAVIMGIHNIRKRENRFEPPD